MEDGKMQGTTNNFKQGSQNAKILEYLLTGVPLTCFKANNLGFGMNLRSRISDLKKAGYKIVSKRIDTEHSYIAEYSLIINEEDNQNGV